MLQPLTSPHRYLFWSAPKEVTSDFVIEDPLAFDYLSQRVGYLLFGGLTTRTSRAQYFPVVLYGLWLVEQEAQARPLGVEDDERKRMFERWERLWALAVHEYRNGEFERSDADMIRGHRGVARTWKPGSDGLPLDFKLISRQSELGSLGAYMSSLRGDAHLVFPGSFRPTALAEPIIEAFWADPGSGMKITAYEQFARLAFDPETKKVPRKYGAITLARIGKLSRLSVLVERERAYQQGLIWRAIFEAAKDHTLKFADVVRLATHAGITEPRAILETTLAGKLGTLTPAQREIIELAVAFGDVQQALLGAFNRAFAAALADGWKTDAAKAATHSLGGVAGEGLRTTCARLLDTPKTSWFLQLPMHGGNFIQLVETLRDASPATGLDAIVHYHAAIHRERRHATPWFRLDAGRLVIDVAAYGNRAQDAGFFPSFKLKVVRSLLEDLGRLP